MSRSCWDIVLERQTPQHLHRCPICHREVRCLGDCTLMLSRSGAWPLGAYVCCSEQCQRHHDALTPGMFNTVNTAQTITITYEVGTRSTGTTDIGPGPVRIFPV